jgi:hypothetical protein
VAKRRYRFDEAKYARMLKEGRGTGAGAAYLPWIEIHDISSKGLSVRPKGKKTGRTHHLLSALEYSVFLEVDWIDDVTDVREQYPLDRECTREIALEMGVRHPNDHGTDIVMTTDLLVDVMGPAGVRLVPISVKPSSDLENDRVLEKMQMEMEYWKRRGASLQIVTEREISEGRTLQLKWLHEWFWLDHLEVPFEGYWEDRCATLLARLSNFGGSRVADFIRHLEEVEGFCPGEALSAIRHLGARKRLSMSLEGPLNMKGDLTQLSLPDAGLATTGDILRDVA